LNAAFDRDAWFLRLLAGATLVMVGLSTPLWAGGDDFPEVPFVAGWPRPGRTTAWTLFAVLLASTLAVAAGRGGRWAWGVSLSSFAWAILGDQDRLQPWVQQYLAIASASVLTGPKDAANLARWYVVVLYAASGLSKVDPAFVDELGATFLTTIGRLAGLSPERWPTEARTWATLAMPIGELAVALALAIPRTRLVGLAGSVVQHLATIAILGPWAMGHSTIVLVWNGAILVENLVLFGPPRTAWTPRGGSAMAAVLVVVALVAGERWGWVDSWPGHALYASHAERSAIFWPSSESDALPPSIRRRLGPTDDEGRRRLDLTGWSRAERGVPVYPQNRVACGVAEALVGRFAKPNGEPVRVVFWGRSGLARSLPRDRVECVGLAALRRRGDRFWINAHPAPWPGPGR